MNTTYYRFSRTFEILENMMREDNSTPEKQVETILEYIKDDISTIPIILSQTKVYLMLIEYCHLLFRSRKVEGDSTSYIDTKMTLLIALCNKFLKSMQRYVPCHIAELDHATISNTIDVINQVNDLKERSYQDKDILSIALLTQHMQALPLFLIYHTNYQKLYQNVCKLEKTISIGAVNSTTCNAITPTQLANVVNLDTHTLLRQAICFAVLERVNLHQALSMKNGGAIFNSEQLSEITRYLKDIGDIDLWYDILKGLGVHVDELSVVNNTHDQNSMHLNR